MIMSTEQHTGDEKMDASGENPFRTDYFRARFEDDDRDTAPIEAKFTRLDEALKDLDILTDKTIQRLAPVLRADLEPTQGGIEAKSGVVNPASKISRVLDDLIETVEFITSKVEGAKLRLEI